MRDKVICLVGSIKQEAQWRDWTELLTRMGYVVFEAGCYCYTDEFDDVTLVHHKKIEMSDVIGVIRKDDGTVGVHTQGDIDHARKFGKMIAKVESIAYNGSLNDW